MKDLLRRAERFARQRHSGQFRKGAAKEPYTIHLEEVQVLLDFLEIMTKHMVVGILMENPTARLGIQILDGLGQECLEEEQIIGEEFL